jgi:hypothetical protein
MSIKNRINWHNPKTLLDRSNLDKMSQDIAASATTESLDKAQRLAQNAYSAITFVESPNNTLVLDNSTKAEIYTFRKANSANNLLTAYGQFKYIDSNNHEFRLELPAGRYVLYLTTTSATSTYDVPCPVQFMYVQDKTKSINWEDKSAFIIFKAFNAELKTPYYIDAPEGISLLTCAASYSDITCFLMKEENYTEPTTYYKTYYTSTNKRHDGRSNLLPYPYQYDYAKSNVTEFDPDDGSPIIDNLKFKDLGDGRIEVSNVKGGKTSRAINLYFHYGTEVKLPADNYTFGCTVLRSHNFSYMNSPWGTCRFIARWQDGDNNSYYPETINNNDITSLKPVKPQEPVTFNAYNGINSISCSLYFSKGLNIPTGQSWYYIPHLCQGTSQLLPAAEEGSYAPEASPLSYTNYASNMVYRYGANLLRPAAPRTYVNSGNNTYLGTLGTDGTAVLNGITVKNLNNGHYLINGTATADTVFQINPGYTYMNPMGTLYFGNIPKEAPSGLSLELRVKFSDNKFKTVTATPGNVGTFESTNDKYMKAYMNTKIKIAAGTVCNNVVIEWSLVCKPTATLDLIPFEKFKMPVASSGYNMLFDYYKVSNATYITNPSLTIAAKVWQPLTNKLEKTVQTVAEEAVADAISKADLSVYAVAFDANGGNGVMPPQITLSNFILPECSFTPEDSTTDHFGWWSTDPNSTMFSKVGSPGEIMEITENTVLYAIWEPTLGPEVPLND